MTIRAFEHLPKEQHLLWSFGRLASLASLGASPPHPRALRGGRGGVAPAPGGAGGLR